MAGSTSYFFLIILGFCLSDTQGFTNGNLRLVGNSGRTGGSSGRLEVYYSRQWGTVCDDSFGVNDARVACRQLGFSTYTQYGTVGRLGFSQASSSTRTWLDELRCSGTESRLINCPANRIGVENCNHSQDIALICTANGDLRLVGSSGRTGGSSGRLEVYYNGTWGTVCDDRFGLYDADVACRQLGYTRGYCWGAVGTLGFSWAPYSNQIWLSNLGCGRNDTTLLSCSHSGLGSHNCSHSEDVAVVCVPRSTCNGSTTTPGGGGGGGGGGSNVAAYSGGSASGTLGCIAIYCCVFCCLCYKSNSSSSNRQYSSSSKAKTVIVVTEKEDSPPPYTNYHTSVDTDMLFNAV